MTTIKGNTFLPAGTAALVFFVSLPSTIINHRYHPSGSREETREE